MVSLPQVMQWIDALQAVYRENKDFLTQLDSDIGDADHGINLDRGFTAVQAELQQNPPADIGALFKAASMTLIKTVGGASGPLYGTVFLKAALVAAGKSELDAETIEALFVQGLEGLKARGKAEVGDKTMIDAWQPAVEALCRARSEGKSVKQMLEAAADAAEQGRDATIPLIARKGRASYLGERSKDHQDPGATSSAFLFRAAAQRWA